MKRKLISLLLLVASFLFIVSCKKNDDNVMPPYSETGEDMIAFKANGVVWKYKWYFSTQPSLTVSMDDISSFYMYVRNKNGSKFSLYINSNVNDVGFYELDITKNNDTYVYFEYENQEYHYYSLDSTHIGYIQINKLDTINNIVAGKFEIDLIGKNNEKMKITEGQFDISY